MHQSQKYLHSFINYENQRQAVSPSLFKLKRVEQLLKLLGHPQDKIKFIHVAGSKGKGSTCAMTAHILKRAGCRVGLYTSPHIQDFRERIRILDNTTQAHAAEDIFPDSISKETLSSLIEEMKPVLEQMRSTPEYGTLSYFEVLTVLAFYYFRRCQVDYAVLETGMGGRLDATNIVDSLVCGITPISLEHTHQLGETLEAIAREKAAIIKSEKSIVIVGPQPPEALEVIKNRCQEMKVRSFFVGQDIMSQPIGQDLDGQSVQIQGMNDNYHVRTHLLGSCQMANGATAVGLVEALSQIIPGLEISREVVERGMADTFWPGRCELIHKRPYVILDGAHNPSSCERLAETIKEIFPDRKMILIVGVSHDKDKKGICQSLSTIAQEVILTKSDHPRAYDWAGVMPHVIFPDIHCTQIDNVPEAVNHALTKAGAEDVVLITGSLFVVGEARLYIGNRDSFFGNRLLPGEFLLSKPEFREPNPDKKCIH